MAEVVDEPQHAEQQAGEPELVPEEKKPGSTEDGKGEGEGERQGENEEERFTPPPPAAASPPVSAFSSISLSIWPPSQRTRTAVLNRLVETLSAPSFLSQRYGTLSPEEASAVAQQIEEEAFSIAASSPSVPEDDGMAILQIYSRNISKRMLEAIKSRNSASPATATTPATATVEEISSESSQT